MRILGPKTTRRCHARQVSREVNRPLMMLAAGVMFLISHAAYGEQTVEATLGKETAWIGEAVPLVVTLYSPGPFSGSARFDLPELPRTALIRMGNPVVGSEEVAGDAFLTQRHEFALYTQQSGEIVIPGFRVRFSGKKDFTSNAEVVEGLTSELRFVSRRPPGAETMRIVISANKMEFQQIWNPERIQKIQAGDIVQRTIIRDAEGTAAMMFPPATIGNLDGVLVQVASPAVDDKVERGVATARRRDVVKYQFQRPGVFDVDDLDFNWWDPNDEAFHRQTLPGRTFEVVAASESRAESSETADDRLLTLKFVAVVAVLFCLVPFLYKVLKGCVAHWQTGRDDPEYRAVHELRAACRAGDAASAYAALTRWLSVRQDVSGEFNEPLLDRKEWRVLREESDSLARQLFARGAPTESWDGGPLWKAFSQVRSMGRQRPQRGQATGLPELNPTLAAHVH